jgi:hypothetical protein
MGRELLPLPSCPPYCFLPILPISQTHTDINWSGRLRNTDCPARSASLCCQAEQENGKEKIQEQSKDWHSSSNPSLPLVPVSGLNSGVQSCKVHKEKLIVCFPRYPIGQHCPGLYTTYPYPPPNPLHSKLIISLPKGSQIWEGQLTITKLIEA